MYYNFTTNIVNCPIVNTQFVQSQSNLLLPVNFTNVYYGNLYSSFNLNTNLITFQTPITFTIKVTALGGTIVYQQA